MNEAKDVFDLMHLLKIVSITVLPLGALIGIILYFKNKALKEEKQGMVDVETLRQQMEAIAREKLAQRERESVENNKQRLKPEEIRRKIESERDDFEESELVIPMQDLEDEMPGDIGEPK